MRILAALVMKIVVACARHYRPFTSPGLSRAPGRRVNGGLCAMATTVVIRLDRGFTTGPVQRRREVTVRQFGWGARSYDPLFSAYNSSPSLLPM